MNQIKDMKKSKQKIMTIVVFSVYMLLLVWLILFKFSADIFDISHMRSINLIPYKESMEVNGQLNMSEILYNILVFVPFGVYVGMLKPQWGFIKKAAPALLVSFALEALQYIFAIGASDITDVIGNTLGGILGVGLFLLFQRFFHAKCISIINGIGGVIETFAIVMLGILLFANM